MKRSSIFSFGQNQRISKAGNLGPIGVGTDRLVEVTSCQALVVSLACACEHVHPSA